MPLYRLIFMAIYFASPLQAAESIANFVTCTLILPDGYTYRPGRGIDSDVGDITIDNKPFKIRYDDYGWDERPKKLSEWPKDRLDSVIYYERVPENPASTFIVAWLHPSAPTKPIVSLSVFGLSFSIQTAGMTEMKDAIAVLRAIKITNAKKPAQ